MPDVRAWLEDLELGQYAARFEAERIESGDLRDLDEAADHAAAAFATREALVLCDQALETVRHSPGGTARHATNLRSPRQEGRFVHGA